MVCVSKAGLGCRGKKRLDVGREVNFVYGSLSIARTRDGAACAKAFMVKGENVRLKIYDEDRTDELQSGGKGDERSSG